VRVTNINKVDLNTFQFDHDLTMAVVLAHPDGTVYHRYGGRTDVSPMNIEGLVEIMREGMRTHREYKSDPAPPQPPLYLPELVNEKLQGRIAPVFGCFHCHYAREARQYVALEEGTWSPDQFWILPEPKRVGIKMDQLRQYIVKEVVPGSPADSAGIEAGDQLDTLSGKRVLTNYDIQWILDGREDKAGMLPFSLRRDGREVDGHMELARGWKVGDPADYSWRVRNVYTEHMNKFLPAPGFTGEQVPADELESRGLSQNAFALKIARLNYGTHLAGVRRGDVVLSAAGKSDFESQRDFYSWCETLRRTGRDIRMRLLRQGSELSLMVSQSHLNYSKVEKAPKAGLGFIVQQLSGSGGLRVGNVDDGCSAEKAGLKVGDRIVAVDGKKVAVSGVLAGMLDNKTPGELLTIDVTRDGEPLRVGFVLSGEEQSVSDVARLSGKVTRPGQGMDCVISIKLPPGKHIYSMHRSGFGVPTQLEFRGSGYKLVGPAAEPSPRKIEPAGLEPMWVLDGEVELKQAIEVADPGKFHLVLHVYAQVCDDKNCHEFRAIIANDGSGVEFSEFRGNLELQRKISGDP